MVLVLIVYILIKSIQHIIISTDSLYKMIINVIFFSFLLLPPETLKSRCIRLTTLGNIPYAGKRHIVLVTIILDTDILYFVYFCLAFELFMDYFCTSFIIKKNVKGNS